MSSCTRTGCQIDGLDVRLESGGFFSDPVSRMLRDAPERYVDVLSPGVSVLLSQLDWHYSNLFDPSVLCFSLREGDDLDARVVAAAWATLVRRKDNLYGMNLSYAVEKRFEGRGLSKLLTCAAAASFIEVHQENGTALAFANCEFRAENRPSAWLAKSIFGPSARFEQFGLSSPNGSVEMGQLRMAIPELLKRCHQTIDAAVDRFNSVVLRDSVETESFAQHPS